MTTRVRVEKADAGALPVMVQVQGVVDGKWVNEGEPKPLMNAAQLHEEHIHQNKRLVVYEFQTGNA